MTEPRDMTTEEAKWVRRLRKVLGSCPDTLQLLTHGDAYLQVLDANRVRELDGEIHDGRARDGGAVLADVPCTVLIHGVSA